MVRSRQLSPSRRAHDEALADGFAPSSLVLSLLFVVFAAWHAVEFPLSVSRVMVPLALATAALAAVTWLVLSRRPLPPGQAHPVAALLACAAYLNCLVQLALTSGEHLTVNVLLLIIAVGVCLVDPLWIALITGGFAVSWTVAVALDGEAGTLSRVTADLVIALIVAAMGNILRRRTLSRLLHAQAQLRELSERCELTGLLNRRGFIDAAERLLRDGRSVTLWFIDVDDLKQVNDRHGHDIGDVLLLGVARVLAEVFPDAAVARLSGDEFAVAEADVSPEQVEDRQARLDEHLAGTAFVPGFVVRVSTGTATSRRGQALSELLSAADAAMYEVKDARRGARAAAVHAGGAGVRATP